MHEIVAVGLNRYDHTRNGWGPGGGFLEELFESLVKPLAQHPKKLTIVLEKDPEHFGNRNDILLDRDFFEDILLDPLGKQNDSLLMARGAEIPSLA